jgi:rhamnopyranosyl-N-acetylglucosaminyl-diphospho-decaprenol beta-1,3/1,4-galactofuranosyltransferase
MEKTIAVIVSYNRQKLLSECIAALRNQTRKLDAILVINNGSTDQTEKWLEHQPDLFFITQKNSGSSGGFNTGISWAFQHGYSWIWCMDDDGYPKENALEKLLEKEMPVRSLLNCAVLNKEDKKSFVWKTKNYKTIEEVEVDIIPGIGHPFNGTLIHRDIVEKVGLPKSSLFLWGDETEYYYRIVKQQNFPVYTIPSSIHYHPAAAFTIKQDWDYKNSWKMYYYVRNRLHVHQAKFTNKLVARVHYGFFLLAFGAIILVYQKTDRLKKLNFIAWPASDAFNNNFYVTPPFILNKLSQPASVKSRLLKPGYLKSIWQSIIEPLTVQRPANTPNIS